MVYFYLHNNGLVFKNRRYFSAGPERKAGFPVRDILVKCNSERTVVSKSGEGYPVIA